MKTLFLCIFIVLFGVNSLWATCESKYQARIEEFIHAISSNQDQKIAHGLAFSVLTGTCITFADFMPLVLFGPVVSTFSAQNISALNNNIQGKKMVENALAIITDAGNGDGTALRELLDNINKDKQDKKYTLAELSALLVQGNNTEDFCQGNEVYTPQGLKEYALKYLNEQ